MPEVMTMAALLRWYDSELLKDCCEGLESTRAEEALKRMVTYPRGVTARGESCIPMSLCLLRRRLRVDLPLTLGLLSATTPQHFPKSNLFSTPPGGRGCTAAALTKR